MQIDRNTPVGSIQPLMSDLSQHIKEDGNPLHYNQVWNKIYEYFKPELEKRYPSKDEDKNEWRSVKDKLPDTSERFIIYYTQGRTKRMFTFDYDAFEKGWLNVLGDAKITHWMPLPDPPKDKDAPNG